MGSDDVFYKWGAGVGAALPRIKDAHDEYLVTDTGEEIIDAASGAAVTNLGHSVEGIGDVLAEQAERVGYVSLTNFTHEATERVAGQLRELSPGDLDTSFFVNSGSEANELAIKLAHAYHRQRGNPEKHVVVSRWQSYHGATLGALSVTGKTKRRSPYSSLLKDWPHIEPAYPYRWSHTGTPEEQARSAARELETVINQHGADSIAAFIAEPVSGASIPAAHPHPAYYHEIRDICDEHDVLFIADEVMTGFGRTGEAFGVEQFDVVPDMMSLGKGMSGGYTPISAVLVRDRVADVFDSDSDEEFAHGHTHSGNPISTAVASAVIDQYDDSLFERAHDNGALLREEMNALEEHPMVGEIRQIGSMLGVEFVADQDSKEPFDPSLEVYQQVYEEALDRGVYVYPGKGSVNGVAGDHVMLTPPLTASAEVIRTIGQEVVGTVEAVYENVTSAR